MARRKKKDDYIEIDLTKYGEIITLIGIVLFASVIELRSLSHEHTLWWDEAEYLSYARSIVSEPPYEMSDLRAVLLPLVLSRWYMFSHDLHFLYSFLFIVYIATAILVYLTIKKISNKKLAFITTLLFISSKLTIVMGHRFLTDMPSLALTLASIYFLKKDKRWVGLFLGLAIATRFTTAALLPIILVYYWSKGDRKLEDYDWLLYLLLGYSPMMLYDIIKFGSPLHSIISFITFNVRGQNDPLFFIKQTPSILGYLPTTFISSILSLFPLIAFVIGLLSLFTRKISKEELVVYTYSIVIYVMYSVASFVQDVRFVLPAVPFLFLITAKGIVIIANSLKKSKTYYILLGVLILMPLYFNITYLENNLTSTLNSSYIPQQMGELIKNHTPEDSRIVTNSPPLICYYSERKVMQFPDTINQLINIMKNDTTTNVLAISSTGRIPSYYDAIVDSEYFIPIEVYLDEKNLTDGVIFLFNRSIS